MSQDQLQRPPEHAKRLWGVLALSAAATTAEAVGGALTGSLSLLADAGHMLTDTAGIAISLLAMRMARRSANREKTFGYHRAEILAALANAALLMLIAIYVLVESVERFQRPPEIRGGWMLAVAALGLAVNGASLFLLRRSSKESLNVQGAYLEVMSDTAGSIGAIVAALVVLTTGWTRADPAVGVAIGLFILPRAWKLLSQSADILLESAPQGVDLEAIRAALQQIAGVQDVHDLHAWSITTGLHALSVHLVIGEPGDYPAVLAQATVELRNFGLSHSTVQVEPADFHGKGEAWHR